MGRIVGLTFPPEQVEKPAEVVKEEPKKPNKKATKKEEE